MWPVVSRKPRRQHVPFNVVDFWVGIRKKSSCGVGKSGLYPSNEKLRQFARGGPQGPTIPEQWELEKTIRSAAGFAGQTGKQGHDKERPASGRFSWKVGGHIMVQGKGEKSPQKWGG